MRLFERARRVIVVAAVTGTAVTGCSGSAQPGGAGDADEVSSTETSDLVPVVDDEGRHVGWMKPDDLASAPPGDAGAVPVYNDEGQVVGQFEMGPDGGFRPQQ